MTVIKMYKDCGRCGSDLIGFTPDPVQGRGIKHLGCYSCGSVWPVDIWNQMQDQEKRKLDEAKNLEDE